MMRQVAVGLLAVALLGAMQLAAPAGPASASNPGIEPAPLLSCPDVSGNGTVDLLDDIFDVALRFGSQRGDGVYHPLYDVADANGAVDLLSDIFVVAARFGDTCPAVDTQVARATLWGINNLPFTQDDAALEELGYYRSSTDVPGQGVHYVNLENWDGLFNPQAPEGLVYHNSKLVAQLYVVDGDYVGWGDHEATSFPPPPVPHDIDLEGDSDGPQCAPACSWAGGTDGWHLHYFLCTVSIGSTGAAAIPGVILNIQDQQDCADFSGGQPECTVPMSVTPCYRFATTVGWMGHLWNHQLNSNLVPDQGGQNGRFADCFPDAEGWKAFNCPS